MVSHSSHFSQGFCFAQTWFRIFLFNCALPRKIVMHIRHFSSLNCSWQWVLWDWNDWKFFNTLGQTSHSQVLQQAPLSMCDFRLGLLLNKVWQTAHLCSTNCFWQCPLWAWNAEKFFRIFEQTSHSNFSLHSCFSMCVCRLYLFWKTWSQTWHLCSISIEKRIGGPNDKHWMTT